MAVYKQLENGELELVEGDTQPKTDSTDSPQTPEPSIDEVTEDGD